MIYTDRKKLTCYVMPDENDEVNFSELSPIIVQRPSNVIYCEKGGKLYGIISMGDIKRAVQEGKDFVTVNKRFTSVKPDEYMRVRQIFKDNEKINALPVVNDLNELAGDYSRWDDCFATVHDFEQLKSNKYAADFWKKNRRFALVRPCREFARKQELMQLCKDNLLQAGVQVSVIDREGVVDAFDFADYILFTDEDEKRGIETLYKYIFNKKELNWTKKAISYGFISNVIGDTIGNAVFSAILQSVMSSGIYVFTLNCEDNKSNYWKRMQKNISDKYSKIGKRKVSMVYEFRKEFFAELYSEEYVKEISNHTYSIAHTDGISKLKDADMETYKVTDGERRTLAQPSNFQRCIYFFGPCIAYGANVADEHTIESFLQARLNAEGYKVKCVNYGVQSDQLTRINRIVSTRFNKGDIVILYNDNEKYEGAPSINLVDICEKHKVPFTWILNTPLHSNHKLNSIYADEIFEMIEPMLQEDKEGKESAEVKNDCIVSVYLEKYFNGFTETHSGINGSIVMNCNPFTFGHRYLIEQALRKVDHLIIFVVEEDKSIFTFKERFAMVTEGTKDLENVTVVPSGNFILSQTTFPEYFLKIEDEDIVHNVEYDITLFAEQIAPKLNITYRFVGEELEDKVTNEYNSAMKRILPEYGINIVEIPRVKTDGKIISASSVRKKLLNGKAEGIDTLIPQTTKKILNACWE